MVDSTKANPYIYYPETICIKVKVSVFEACSNYRFEHKKSNHQTCDNLHFYRPQKKFAKVMFLHLSVSHSVHRGHAWLRGGGHAWLLGGGGAGGMHGCSGGCAWFWGVCMVVGGNVWLPGGHAWLRWGGRAWLWGACMVVGGACVGYDEIRSISRRYASYWDAFLFRTLILTTVMFKSQEGLISIPKKVKLYSK